ncbi:MAG TPA: hypothetical protein VN457_07335, partial [Chlamydiales bacterium]|nr:hypothetical protein [Chlamydiales bacterium]
LSKTHGSFSILITEIEKLAQAVNQTSRDVQNEMQTSTSMQEALGKLNSGVEQLLASMKQFLYSIQKLQHLSQELSIKNILN